MASKQDKQGPDPIERVYEPGHGELPDWTDHAATKLVDRITTKKILLCLGPGGVGKTTFSAAMAVTLAKAGKRTLVCTLDPARRLAQALGVSEEGGRPKAVPSASLAEAGLPMDLPMETAILDVAGTMDRALAQECGDPTLQEAIQSNVFYRLLVEDLEGAQMYAALAQLQDLAEESQWDHIVVDTPPTVHLHDLLVAPYRITHAVRSPFLRWLASSKTWTGRTGLAILSLGRMRLLRRAASVVGGRFLEQMSQFIGLISDLLPILEQRAERAEELLKSRDTAYIIVTVPSPDRVTEAVSLSRQLKAQEMELLGLVINRISPFADQDAVRQLAGQAFPTPKNGPAAATTGDEGEQDLDPAGCRERMVEFAETMGTTERAALWEMKARMDGLPVIPLPLLGEDLTGLTEVAVIADRLGHLEASPNP